RIAGEYDVLEVVSAGGRIEAECRHGGRRIDRRVRAVGVSAVAESEDCICRRERRRAELHAGGHSRDARPGEKSNEATVFSAREIDTCAGVDIGAAVLNSGASESCAYIRPGEIDANLSGTEADDAGGTESDTLVTCHPREADSVVPRRGDVYRAEGIGSRRAGKTNRIVAGGVD